VPGQWELGCSGVECVSGFRWSCLLWALAATALALVYQAIIIPRGEEDEDEEEEEEEDVEGGGEAAPLSPRHGPAIEYHLLQRQLQHHHHHHTVSGP
jgi:hypothetical protein